MLWLGLLLGLWLRSRLSNRFRLRSSCRLTRLFRLSRIHLVILLRIFFNLRRRLIIHYSRFRLRLLRVYRSWRRARLTNEAAVLLHRHHILLLTL
jgi:hypothetical protein